MSSIKEIQKRKTSQAWKEKIKEIVKQRNKTKEEIEAELIAAEKERKIAEIKLAEEKAI